MDKAHVQIGSIGPGFESCLEAAFFPPRRFSAGPTKSCEIVNFVFRQEIKQLASSLDCSSRSRNLACGFFAQGLYQLAHRLYLGRREAVAIFTLYRVKSRL